MTRAYLFAVVLLCGATAGTPVLAQAGALAAGDTVRVRNAIPLLHRGDNTGILVRSAGDTLVLRSLTDSGVHSWLLQEPSRVSVKRGRKSFGVVKGVLIAAAVATVGTLVYEGSDSFAKQGCELVGYSQNGNPIYGNCERDRREGGTVVIPLSAVVGGVAGHLIKRPRWVDVRRERTP